MNAHLSLSLEKSIAYLGDLQSATGLLATLETTLQNDIFQIEQAIHTHHFELLQKIMHQLKGFAPIFCTDELVNGIVQTENLCKKTTAGLGQTTALAACSQLLINLKGLQAEVSAHLQATSVSAPPIQPSPQGRSPT